MKRKKIYLLGVLVLLVAVIFAVPVLAAETQDVEVTFTPAYLSISNAPESWDVGVVNTSTNYTTGQGYFTVTNTSSVSCNLTIGVTADTWTGGSASTHSDTATAGSNTVGLTSSDNTGAYDVIVKYADPNYLYEDLSAGVDVDWELKFVSATEWVDSAQKTNTVRLTVSRP